MVADASIFVVRPFSKPARADLKDAFRIYLAPGALTQLGLKPGDLCEVWKDPSKKGKAVAWPPTEKLQENIVQTSKILQSTYGLRLGDKLSVQKSDACIRDIAAVYLRELQDDCMLGSSNDEQRREKFCWEWFLEKPLEEANFLTIGLVIENIHPKGRNRSFRVERIRDDSNSPQTCGAFQPTSKVHIAVQGGSSSGPPDLSNLHITGLDSQIKELDGVLKRIFLAPRPHGRPRPGGILFHGPSGTGKSMLLEGIAGLGWGEVFRLDAAGLDGSLTNKREKLQTLFRDARAHSPSLILIDHLEALAPKGNRHDGDNSLAAALRCQLMAVTQMTSDARVIVLSATNRPYEIDSSLLKRSCFQFKIDFPVAGVKGRTEILKEYCGLPADAKDLLLEELGERTHGFTGDDLCELVEAAEGESWKQQLGNVRDQVAKKKDADGDSTAKRLDGTEITREGIEIAREGIEITREGVDKALLQFKPSVMRDIFLEVPKVRWTEIGGQQHVKQAFRETFEWQLKYPEEMKRLGIPPKKGLLLHGPPGCSKTMAAKAFATESGLNFLAVKGPELLNMYVGESERALREVFYRAKAASPSIIFFDEFEAIAKSRDGHEAAGLNMVTTLLNELDGIEPLRGVTVLAATNTPELIDSAVLRPGRFDKLLYVGPPDLQARCEILRIQTAERDVARDEIDLEFLAQEMDGYTGAEVVTICAKAAGQALVESKMSGVKEKIRQAHFIWAMTQVHRETTPGMCAKYEQWVPGRKL